jgi:hypothetical protein
MELINLWCIYNFFYEDLITILPITKSDLSDAEKLEYLKQTPNFFLRKAVENKIESFEALKKNSFFRLPFHALSHWSELIDIFNNCPKLNQSLLFIQLSLLTLWSFCFSEYLFIQTNTLLFFLIVMALIIALTFIKNLLLTFFLCRFYLWSKLLPRQYFWDKERQIPSILKNKYKEIWISITEKNPEQNKAIKQMMVNLKIKIFKCQRSYIHLADILLICCYFFSIIQVGQDFFENLYLNQSSLLGKFS